MKHLLISAGPMRVQAEVSNLVAHDIILACAESFATPLLARSFSKQTLFNTRGKYVSDSIAIEFWEEQA